jgi:hypothetical protein
MLYKCCLTCKHWQGTKYSTWGDCHYVCADLNPRLLDEKNLFGWNFTLPFDPHDVKYFDNLCLPLAIDDDVRGLRRKENDIVFMRSQYDGSIIGERVAPQWVVYYQTFRFKEGCTYYETLHARS